MADHERFMRRAVELAYEAMESGKGRPFGAVIVRNNEIVAEGHNEVPYRMDITAHAETVTLGRATQALNKLDLSDCDIYVGHGVGHVRPTTGDEFESQRGVSVGVILNPTSDTLLVDGQIRI